MQTKTKVHHTPDEQHILLTSLGKNAYKTEYEWQGDRITASLTPLALVQFLEEAERPNRVVTLVTEEAEQTTWPIFQEDIHKILGVTPERVEIPIGSNDDEIRQILAAVAREIPEGAQLTLDVTQGLRHFPFIFYALVLYLKSLRGVKVRGVYYGMVDAVPKEEPKPIIDLHPLLELPEWFYAVRMFREHGTTSPIAQLLQPLATRLLQEKTELFVSGDRDAGREREKPAKQVEGAVEALEKYAFAYESALPIELGAASAELSSRIEALATLNIPGTPPLATELATAVTEAAEETAFAVQPGRKGEWKTRVPLDKNELVRQARMIDRYLAREQLPLAFGLMREWVVSWAIFQSDESSDEPAERWLDKDSRKCYEQRLGALGAFAGNQAFRDIITPAQQDFGTFWNQLTDQLRNALHHHGMRESAVAQPLPSLQDVQESWNQLKEMDMEPPTLGGGDGTLLLSPQGTSPGVLFSALKVAKPDTCLVICSEATADSIPEAAKRAGFEGKIEQIELAEPHSGYAEIAQVVAKAREALLNADVVVANMTGGTTLMGIVIQQMTEEACKLNREVRRFALVDRRTRAEQENNPFVRGKEYWLDKI